MPEFSTAFNSKKSDRKLTNEELIRAIRFSVASEYESIQIYEEIAESIDNKDAKKLLLEIANDEKVHAGNFSYLLNLLSPEDEKSALEGRQEAADIINGEEE